MARTRLLHPGFFRNELLAEVPPLGRLLFAGMWTLADKAGRLEDRPKRIQADLLPWDNADIEALLDALAAREFIRRYSVNGESYIQIVKFDKYQKPHIREKDSMIPPCPEKAVPRHDLGSVEASPRWPVSVSVSDPVSVSVPTPISDPVLVPKTVSVSRTKSSGGNAARVPSENVNVITKIAHEAISLIGINSPDLPDTIKNMCATSHIAYDSATVAKALDSARHQRQLT